MFLEKEENSVESLLEENKVDISSENLFVVYDKDGPLEDPSVSTAETWGGVEEVVGSLESSDGLEFGVVSGWDVDTLRRRRQEYLDDSFLLGGSMGTVVEKDGEKKLVHEEVSKDDIYESFRNVFQQAAEYGEGREGLKILPQGNSSNLVASIKFEAENDRADVGRISDQPSTEEIYEAILDREAEGFEKVEENGVEKILFSNSSEDSRVLAEVFTEDFIYPGVRFEERDDERIAFYRDERDLEEFEKEEGYSLLMQAAPQDIKVKPYEDWGADLIKEVDHEFGKPAGVEKLGEEAYGEEDYTGIMIGDSTTDLEVAQEHDNFYFAAISGSEAEKEARREGNWKEGEDYIVVQNGVDFTVMFSEAMENHREDWEHEYDSERI